jgi:hypothetical protein
LPVGTFALEDVGPVGPELVTSDPAAQDVLVVVRAGKIRGSDNNLPVPVPVARLGRPSGHSRQYTRAWVRGTRSLGPSKPPFERPSSRCCDPRGPARGRGEALRRLEHDRDALMDSYAGMVKETLEDLTLEERHRIYKLLRLGVRFRPD